MVGKVNNSDFFYNEIYCRPGSADSRTENLISMGHLVAEILNVKVQEINNLLLGNNCLFVFFIFFP